MANFSFLDSTGLTTLWAKIKNTFVASSTKGVAGGVASLDNSGKVPSSQLPTYPTVNNGNLYLQAGGVTKITFTANQSTDSTFNIDEGSADGTIAVGGTNVSVKGLKALAYKQSLVESDIPALSISKITNLQTSLNNKLETSLKGAASGLAELDSGGKVPTSQLPSYVDDVLEYASKTNFPSTGEAGKIYVALDTNLTYRWGGTAYVEISPSLALGITSDTAYYGDKGKIAYDHSQSTHARTDATAVTSSSTNGNIKINGTETTVYTHPTTAGNKHIPSGGSANQFLKYSSSGTAVWADNPVLALDVNDISGFGAGKTLATLTETDGKIAATFQNISITHSQISDYPTTIGTHSLPVYFNNGTPTVIDSLSVSGDIISTGGGVAAYGIADLSISSSGGGIGTVTGVAVNGTTYEPNTEGVVTIPNYSTFASGDVPGAFQVTPASGSPESIQIYGLGNAAYKDTGTTSGTVATGDHNHQFSFSTTSGTANVTLSAGTKYQVKAGGSELIIRIPDDTWRDITNIYNPDGTASSSISLSQKGAQDMFYFIAQNVLTDIAWSSNKLTKTINGTTSDVVSISTIKTALALTKSDVGLGNVGNFKAVSTVANQGLTSTEKSNARANIGAGTSNLTIGTTASTAAAGDHTHSSFGQLTVELLTVTDGFSVQSDSASESIMTFANSSSSTLGKLGVTSDGFVISPDGNSWYTLYSEANLDQDEVRSLLGTLPVANGGTGATSASGARTNLGLGSAATYSATTSVTQNSSALVTSGGVWSAINALPTPMQFKGSVGTNGTITWANLPSASSSTGYTYKVITDHTSAPVCKAGDTIISNGTDWVVIPSGDEPSGTVTSVGISVPTGLSVAGSPITSQGLIAISYASGYAIPTTAKQSNWDTAYSNSHTHSNKSVLDGISSTNVSNWGTAYTNSHTHSNKSVLDGITSTKVSNWDIAYGWGNHADAGYLLATTAASTYLPKTGGILYSSGNNFPLTIKTGESGSSGIAGIQFMDGNSTTFGSLYATKDTALYFSLSNQGGTNTYTVLHSGNSSVSLSGSTLTVKINGVEKSLTNTNTTYSAGTDLSLSGTTFAHANSGATAGSYGDSSAQTPAYGGTFKVPYITINARGHVTGISEHTVKIPASDNTWRPLGYGATDAAYGNHLYHKLTSNGFYWESYAHESLFRIVTESFACDTLRFKANTISNVEYWSGSAWTTWNKDLSPLFDGNPTTGISIPYAQRKFRFQITASSGWPTTALILLEGRWFDSGAYSESGIVFTLESRSSTSASFAEDLSFTFPNSTQGTNARVTGVLHTGRTLYRITVTLPAWANTSNNPTLYRLGILSNYSGNAVTTTDYDSAGNFKPDSNETRTLGTSSYKWLNVYATTFTENGTALSSKYLGISAKAADSDKLDGNDSSYYLNYNNLNNKPTIPSVSNATITIKQTGISDQTFTLNGSAKTITLVDTTYTSKAAASGGTAVSLVTTGEKYTWNNKQDAISDLATIRSNATHGESAYNSLSNYLLKTGGILYSSGNSTPLTIKTGSDSVDSAGIAFMDHNSTQFGSLFASKDVGLFFSLSNQGGTSTYTVLHSGNSSVSLSGSTLTVTINGVSKSLTNTNTTYSAGSGLSLSGTTFNHSNSVTAQTTQALYPIKIDAQGHISAYGSAVTSLPASDVYAWAKASTKPSYAFSEITGTVTNAQLAGSIANNKLANSSVSIAGTSVSLGSSISAATLQSNLGLGGAAYKAVVTSVDTSASLPTSNAVKTFVEGKGYVTSSGVTSVATGTGLTGGTITGTGTISINSTYQTYISHGESAYNSLSSYLPLTGGQIYNSSTAIPLTVKGPAAQGAYIKFSSPWSGASGSYDGVIGVDGDGYFKVAPRNSETYYDLLHSGNSSVSLSGSTLTVKINGVEKSLTNTNTTYTIATGDSNGQIKVTPSSGSAYNVNVKGLGSAAYTASSDYATAGHNHTTSIATSSATNQLTLAFGTKYAITAGETSYVFTMPSRPSYSFSEISGTVSNAQLANNSITVSGCGVSLGGSISQSSLRTGLGLGNAAYKGVTDNSSSTAVTSSDTNLITGRTLYYAGYVKSSGVTSVATGTGLTGGTITSTGTISINDTYQTYISHGEIAYNSLGSYLLLSGGTMTGTLTTKANLYDDSYSGALNMNNSNIYGLNAIYTCDTADGAAEGINFYRDATHVDTFWMTGGNMYFVPNRTLGTNTTAANSYTVLHSGNSSVSLSGSTLTVKINGTSQSLTNTWRPLGTGASDACAGNDSRLSNARPASDVYSWAKQSSLVMSLAASSSTGTVLSLSANTQYCLTAGGSAIYFNTPNDTTYSAATQSAAGLMSAADKKKLDGVATGATAVSESTVSGWGFTKNAGTVTSVKVGSTSYSPSSGVVSLPAYPTTLPASDVYTWAKKSSLQMSLAGSSASSGVVQLAAGTQYCLTAGDSALYFSTPAMRPLGTGATDACAGNDSRLSNARTPVAHASSATTYGVGTTANYGHVKLATGDMNGASGADGVACGKNHTHSQYLPLTGGTVGGGSTNNPLTIYGKASEGSFLKFACPYSGAAGQKESLLGIDPDGYFWVTPSGSSVSYALLHSGNIGSYKGLTTTTFSGTSLSCSIDTYYRASATINTLAVTLPAVSGSTTRSILLYLTTGTSPNITFTGQNGLTVKYYASHYIQANKTYEINALYNGNIWIVSSAEIS